MQVRLLYKGTLRVLLVLLHDFPEFLCDHHFSFCNVIPASCIQMRNLILSAFPRNMRLPDPFTPNLKVNHRFTQSLAGAFSCCVRAKTSCAGLLVHLSHLVTVPPSEKGIGQSCKVLPVRRWICCPRSVKLRASCPMSRWLSEGSP